MIPSASTVCYNAGGVGVRQPKQEGLAIMTAQTLGNLHEQTANTIIARWLNTIGRSWTAAGDRTRTMAGSSERPDIIITEGGRMPAVIECEYDDQTRPAISDARQRLGRTLVDESRPLTEVIAVGIAAACKNDSDEQFPPAAGG